MRTRLSGLKRGMQTSECLVEREPNNGRERRNVEVSASDIGAEWSCQGAAFQCEPLRGGRRVGQATRSTARGLSQSGFPHRTIIRPE